jgi:hypothetical protein
MTHNGARVITAEERKNYPALETQYSIPLYTHPPQRQWVGLTEDDWDEIFENVLTIGEAIKVTEVKLKEKNSG